MASGLHTCHILSRPLTQATPTMEFVKAEVNAGNQVYVICPSDGEHVGMTNFHGATVNNLPTSSITHFSIPVSLRYVRMILDALKGQRFDGMYVYEFRGCSLLPIFGRHLSRTWLVNIRNSNLHTHGVKLWLADWLTAQETRPYAMTIVCDTGIGEQMLGQRDFWVIPNGVDLEKYRRGRRDETRAKLGFAPTDKVIVYIGTMVAQRRPERMLETFAKVVAAYPEAKLLAVGDSDRMEQMTEWVRTHGLTDRVVLPGRVPYDVIQDYVAAADIGLAYYPALPNFQQNIPLKTAELLAANLPTVATDTPGNRFYITHEHNGLLADDDPAELAGAIVRLLQEPELAARLRQFARASVMDYDWGHLVREKLLPLYTRYAA